MANPFSVAVPNALEALLLGEQSYNQGVKARQEEQKRSALSQLLMGGNFDPKQAAGVLLQNGDTSGATQFATLANTIERNKADDAWRREEATRTQRNADRSYALQERSQRRLEASANETPVDKMNARIKVLQAQGVDPNSAEGRRFAMTGEWPAASASAPSALVGERVAAANAAGLKPDHPGYQGFLLTGKLPREDAQNLTAGDKEAIRTADDAVIANQAGIDSLKRAQQLSRKAFAGPMAGARGYAASFLGDTSELGKSGIATENLTNEVMTNALGQLKSIFGGNPTEGERRILLDLQGSVSKPDAVRQAIFDRAIAAAQKRLEFNQKRADDLRGGTYYKPPGAAPAVQQPPAPTAQPNVTASGVTWSIQ